ncbi:MAG TPA: FHA domain-containing protein [Woeseiaceae bacterium]|nr:FHA domain-containing protein [Woeseiaceae bacterium]
MKSIVEQYNVCRRLATPLSDAPRFPVLGRLCRSSLAQLERSYREGAPVAILVSHSRFAPGYVVDSFLAGIDTQATVIRIEQSFDDPTAFMDEVVNCLGFDCEGLGLADFKNVLGLFLRSQKMKRRRTVLVVRDIDAHGKQVLARVRELIDMEAGSQFGLMIVLTGPANDMLEPMDPILEAIAAHAGERILLTPFSLPETREFVRERYERPEPEAGEGDDTGRHFDFYAVGLIHELSAGVPETVDLLCSKAVEIAVRDDETAVTTKIVKAAARVLGLIPATADTTTEPPLQADDVSGDASGQLIVKVQGKAARTIDLNGSSLLIGRDRFCDICVDDVQVSRLHGLIARTADGVHFVDLGSKNGSAINGQATTRLSLENNDVIAVGDVRIIYSAKPAAESEDVDLDLTDTFEIPNEDTRSPIDVVGRRIRERGRP